MALLASFRMTEPGGGMGRNKKRLSGFYYYDGCYDAEPVLGRCAACMHDMQTKRQDSRLRDDR